MSDTVNKPSYLELLNKRVAADARGTCEVRVCLRPELEDELRTLRERPGRRNLADTGQSERLAELEAEIRAATLVVTLRALSVGDLVTSQAKLSPTSPQGESIKAQLGVAMVAVHDADGNPVTDIGRDEWRRLLDVMPAQQLQVWHGQLAKAGQAVDFPM